MLVDAKRVPVIPDIEPMVESEVDMDISITQTENYQFFCGEEEEEEEEGDKNNEIAYLGREEELKPPEKRKSD